ncbi:MAG: homoserine kinase [Saprospiraceae bacterium]|nr:homoserine kinase [Saprospiraceae bacterium]
MLHEVKVFAPASVGNAIVGFDMMGLALSRPGDEIVARRSERPGLHITAITGDEGKLPYDPEKNTAGLAASSLLKHLDKTGLGIELEIHKCMPFGSGLGSSAASAVGGAFAVNVLLGSPLSKRELLPFAMQGEQLASGGYHADNVAPSLLGGIILIRSNRDLDVLSLPVPTELYAAVVYPEVEILTKTARGILKTEVPLKQHVVQSGYLGGFMAGLFCSDYDLIGRSLRDVIIEPQRACMIPHFYEVQQAALSAGALGCSISGAGPSMVALCKGDAIAAQVGAAMQQIFTQAGIPNELFLSAVNAEGAIAL